jgi:hypothetical protein
MSKGIFRIAGCSLGIVASGSWLVVSFAWGNEPVRDGGDGQPVSFATLSSFPYSPPARRVGGARTVLRPDPFPPEVRALHGKKVSISGFMVPLTMKGGRIDSFYLSRGVFGCCYADMPRISDYIKVTMPPGQYAPSSEMSQVSGVLEVGEEFDAGGYVETVYRLRAISVQPRKVEDTGWLDAAVWAVAGIVCLGLFGPVVVRLVKLRRERRAVGAPTN